MASQAAASATSAWMAKASAPRAWHGLHRLLGGGGVAGVVHGHPGALPGQLQADRPADAPAAAGDQGAFSL